GDNWDHDIVIESTTSASEDATIPDCIDGRRACPPEDCGGLWGYREFLDILADPTHPEHDERLEWTGGPIDPDAFDPTDFADNLHQQTLASFDLFDQ
ncbi:MAG: plasmid pRiA4b ORF-3 family protein, partial [Thermoanaerobaculales bacterium]|nr:plasmid pRiA4b ORF-3 family protein [Thermoanaerobaculales bacterium]